MITVHLHTILQINTPTGRQRRLEIDLPPGGTIGDLLGQLDVVLAPDALIFLVNGRPQRESYLLKDGDEVIVPSFTFVSTINAFVLRGAKPVFLDVRPDTLNVDESKLEALISPKTRAIVVVHYAGVGCEMDAIMEIANRRNIPVIEDNAHGLFGTYKGKQRRLGLY